jgi:hypothetical protein
MNNRPCSARGSQVFTANTRHHGAMRNIRRTRSRPRNQRPTRVPAY